MRNKRCSNMEMEYTQSTIYIPLIDLLNKLSSYTVSFINYNMQRFIDKSLRIYRNQSPVEIILQDIKIIFHPGTWNMHCRILKALQYAHSAYNNKNLRLTTKIKGLFKLILRFSLGRYSYEFDKYKAQK